MARTKNRFVLVSPVPDPYPRLRIPCDSPDSGVVRAVAFVPLPCPIPHRHTHTRTHIHSQAYAFTSAAHMDTFAGACGRVSRRRLRSGRQNKR